MEFYSETLFADLDVFRECSVCEAESVGFIDNIYDSAGVKRVKAKMVRKQRDVAAGLDRSVVVDKTEARNLEHLPFSDRLFCSVENVAA